MQNLLRIKLDPRRGGNDNIDFLRPNFIISNWYFPDLDIWCSFNGGTDWIKLQPDSDYLFCFNHLTHDLYVSFLIDFTQQTLIAFFPPTGYRVGLGFTIDEDTEPDCLRTAIPLGWSLDSEYLTSSNTGWCTGSLYASLVPAGFQLDGSLDTCSPVGWFTRFTCNVCVSIAFITAHPVDLPIAIGFSIGNQQLTNISSGCVIAGLSEYAVKFIALDNPSFASLASSAVVNRQKLIVLNQYTPEVLD